MTRPYIAGLVLVLVAGCGDDEDASQRPEDRQAAYVHTIVRSVAELPGVACAQGGLDTQGLSTAPVGAIYVRITPEPGVTDAQQREMTREAGKRVWLSPLAVSTLTVNTGSTSVTLGDVLGAKNTFVERAELEAAYGPQPPVATPLPTVPDPGSPAC